MLKDQGHATDTQFPTWCGIESNSITYSRKSYKILHQKTIHCAYISHETLVIIEKYHVCLTRTKSFITYGLDPVHNLNSSTNYRARVTKPALFASVVPKLIVSQNAIQYCLSTYRTIFWTGVFLWVVADTVSARNKYHGCRTPSARIHTVVTSP